VAKKEIITTLTQRCVYAELINLNAPLYPRTQTQVAEILGMPRSTVCDCVRKLCDLEIIRPKTSDRTDILYKPGRYHKLIESYIELDRKHYGESYTAAGRAVTPPTAPKRYIPTTRAHLNGGWLAFDVLVEGVLGTIPAPKDEVRIALFGSTKPNERFTGSENYYNTFQFGTDRLRIRYQRTEKVCKFYVSPPSLQVECSSVDNTTVDLFVGLVAPFLRYLEKYGGWVFAKDDSGNYICQAKVRPEYGFDSTISDAVKDVAPEIGIPGRTPFWNDDSPDSMGDGEFETNEVDYVHAIHELPATTRKVAITAEVVASLANELKGIGGNLQELAALVNAHSKLAVMAEKLRQSVSQQFVAADGNDEDGRMYR